MFVSLESLCIMSLKSLSNGFGLLTLFLSHSPNGNFPTPPNFLHRDAEYGRIDDLRGCSSVRGVISRVRRRVTYYKGSPGSKFTSPKVQLPFIIASHGVNWLRSLVWGMRKPIETVAEYIFVLHSATLAPSASNERDTQWHVRLAHGKSGFATYKA